MNVFFKSFSWPLFHGFVKLLSLLLDAGNTVALTTTRDPVRLKVRYADHLSCGTVYLSGTILILLIVVIVVPRSLAGIQTGRPGTPDSLT